MNKYLVDYLFFRDFLLPMFIIGCIVAYFGIKAIIHKIKNRRKKKMAKEIRYICLHITGDKRINKRMEKK
jgi:hypothetical protein